MTVTFPATSAALPAADVHRQHRLARRPAQRVRGLFQLGQVPPPAQGGGTPVRAVRRNAAPAAHPVPNPHRPPPVAERRAYPCTRQPGNAPTPTPERGVATPCPETAPDEARRRPARPLPSPAPPAPAVGGCSPACSPGCSSSPHRSSPPRRPARHQSDPVAAAARVAMLAGLSATMTASSYNQNYVAGNANDGNQATYWESANNAFPQWLQVDLGAAVSVDQVVLKLPPAAGWADPHPDAGGAGQHQRLDLHRPGGVRRLHLQPGQRQHGDDQLHRRHHPVRAGATSPPTPAGRPARSPSSRSTAPPPATTPRRRPRPATSPTPSPPPARSG